MSLERKDWLLRNIHLPKINIAAKHNHFMGALFGRGSVFSWIYSMLYICGQSFIKALPF